MSAPGIQLNLEPHLTLFQPSIRQYVQSVVEAVVANNLPAARQAFTHLAKAVPSTLTASSGQGTDQATRIQRGVQALGRALETGELGAARQAAGELGVNIQPTFDGQGGPQQSAASEPVSGAGSDATAAEITVQDGGSNLNVRA